MLGRDFETIMHLGGLGWRRQAASSHIHEGLSLGGVHLFLFPGMGGVSLLVSTILPQFHLYLLKRASNETELTLTNDGIEGLRIIHLISCQSSDLITIPPPLGKESSF
jgi:hypothetical protein